MYMYIQVNLHVPACMYMYMYTYIRHSLILRNQPIYMYMYKLCYTKNHAHGTHMHAHGTIILYNYIPYHNYKPIHQQQLTVHVATTTLLRVDHKVFKCRSKVIAVTCINQVAGHLSYQYKRSLGVSPVSEDRVRPIVQHFLRLWIHSQNPLRAHADNDRLQLGALQKLLTRFLNIQ